MKEDVELHYEAIGQGSPLVLIHGWGGDWSNNLFQIPLAYHYRLILPDLRGHGRSPKPQTECTAEILATDVNRLLEKLDVEKAIVCGRSLGGMVALQLALDYPQKVEALILVNTASTASAAGELFDELISLLSAPNPVETLGGMMSSLPAFIEVSKSPIGSMFIEAILEGLEQLEPKALIELTRGMKRFDVTDRLSEIEIPTLIVGAAQDSATPVVFSEEMHKRIAGSEYAIIDAEHALAIIRPDEFNKLVRNFLKKIGH